MQLRAVLIREKYSRLPKRTGEPLEWQSTSSIWFYKRSRPTTGPFCIINSHRNCPHTEPAKAFRELPIANQPLLNLNCPVLPPSSDTPHWQSHDIRTHTITDRSAPIPTSSNSLAANSVNPASIASCCQWSHPAPTTSRNTSDQTAKFQSNRANNSRRSPTQQPPITRFITLFYSITADAPLTPTAEHRPPPQHMVRMSLDKPQYRHHTAQTHLKPPLKQYRKTRNESLKRSFHQPHNKRHPLNPMEDTDRPLCTRGWR